LEAGAHQMLACWAYASPSKVHLVRGHEATRRRSAHSKTHEIRTWHFLRSSWCGASWTAAALYLPPKAEIFWRLRAGRSPARCRAAAPGGGAEEGPPPPPQRFLRSCWAGEGLSAYQEGQMGQKFVCSLWAARDTARSRQGEPIERRPEEQGTQDAGKANEGMRISGAMAIEPPSM
jgi:hypothetical protein